MDNFGRNQRFKCQAGALVEIRLIYEEMPSGLAGEVMIRTKLKAVIERNLYSSNLVALIEKVFLRVKE